MQREQTLMRVPCLGGLNNSALDHVFDWKFNLDRLLRKKMNVPDPSLQIITSLLSIVKELTSKGPLFRHRLHDAIEKKTSIMIMDVSCCRGERA